MSESAEVARTAVVTGASAGIGAVFARRLAARGHDLVLTARRAERLDALAEELRRIHGATVEILLGDLAEPGAQAELAARVAGEDVTLLVNNAGINGYGPFQTV